MRAALAAAWVWCGLATGAAAAAGAAAPLGKVVELLGDLKRQLEEDSNKELLSRELPERAADEFSSFFPKRFWPPSAK